MDKTLRPEPEVVFCPNFQEKIKIWTDEVKITSSTFRKKVSNQETELDAFAIEQQGPALASVGLLVGLVLIGFHVFGETS